MSCSEGGAMIIASVTPYIVFPLAGLLWVDAVRHVVVAWAVVIRADKSYVKHRPESTRHWLIQSLDLPYPDAPAEAAARYRRNMTRFVYELLAFGAVVILGLLLLN
jgi:hypothetical protein